MKLPRKGVLQINIIISIHFLVVCLYAFSHFKQQTLTNDITGCHFHPLESMVFLQLEAEQWSLTDLNQQNQQMLRSIVSH